MTNILYIGIYVCGTLRQGRCFLPDQIKSPGKLLRGNHIIFQDQDLTNLTTCVWQDTHQVGLYIPFVLNLQSQFPLKEFPL